MKKMIITMIMTVALVGVTSAWASEVEDAEKAYRSFATAIANLRLDEIVDLLPASMIAKTETDIRTFAERMDIELWDKGRDVTYKCLNAIATNTNLMDTLAEIIIPMLNDLPEGEEGASLEVFQEELKQFAVFLKGDAMTLDSLKKIDVKAFATAMAPMISRMVATNLLFVVPMDTNWGDVGDASQLKITGEKISDDTILFTAEGHPGTRTMKRVEGKWVTDVVAEGSGSTISFDSLTKIDFTTDAGQQNKARAMAAMGMLESMLKKIEAAETKDAIKFIIMTDIPLIMSAQ